jgi:hypothetical protein
MERKADGILRSDSSSDIKIQFVSTLDWSGSSKDMDLLIEVRERRPNSDGNTKVRMRMNVKDECECRQCEYS